MKDALCTMKDRSSTRGYSAEAISAEALTAILQAGLEAPTARNMQEIFFSVLTRGNPLLDELEAEKNRLQNLPAQENNFYYNAPAVVILSADNGFRWSTLDAGIAVENMALAAEALGLGSVIIGCIYDAMHGEKEAYFASALKFPENYGFKIALAIGHKATEKIPHTFDAAAQIAYL